jgi:hypothetical protein
LFGIISYLDFEFFRYIECTVFGVQYANQKIIVLSAPSILDFKLSFALTDASPPINFSTSGAVTKLASPLIVCFKTRKLLLPNLMRFGHPRGLQ